MKNLVKTSIGVTLTAVFIQAQAPNPSKPAIPLEPVGAILDAFRSHPLVALGNMEGGNEQSHAFQLSLIRDPRFAATVNDIVVEFGNARYQDVANQFVRGEEVRYDSLRRVWQNTTQVEFEWDLPIYEELFRAVRSANASLPRERQLRVLLGDPPIDWDKVHSLQDLQAETGNRDAYAVEVIQREILSKGRRALVIYGTQHLIRKNTVIGAPDEWARGLVAQLERAGVTKLFTISPETRIDLKALQPDVASWPKPSLAILQGTPLGKANFAPGPRQRAVRMEEQFDSLLYLGPLSEMTSAHLSPELCSDPSYMQMRLARLALVPPPPGAPASPADLLKQSCAGPARNVAVQDLEPNISALVAATIRDAAQGKVDPRGLAPESQERLSQFLNENGPRFLGPAGSLESLTLLVDSRDGNKLIRRYRSVFGNGEKVVWTVELSPAGKIVSMAPRPE